MQEQLTVQFILVLVTQSTLAAVDYIPKLNQGQCNIVKEPSQWYPRPVAIHVGHQCYPFVPDDGSSDNVYFPDQSSVCCSCDYDRPATFPTTSSLWSESPIGTEIAETPFTSSLISDHTPSGHVSEVSTPIWGGSSLQPGGSPEGSTPSSVGGTTQFLGGPEGEGGSSLQPGGSPESSTPSSVGGTTQFLEGPEGEGVSGLTNVMGTESSISTHEETSTVLPGGAASPGNGSSTIPSMIEGPSIESSTLAQEETSTVLPGGTESGIPGGFPAGSTQNSLEESTLISENVSITTPSALEEVSGLPTTQSNLTSTGTESAIPSQEGPSSVLPVGATAEPGMPGVSTPSSLEESTGFSANTLITISTPSEAVAEPVTPLTNLPGTGVESSTPSHEGASTVQPGGSESGMPGGFSENPLEGYTGISGTTSEGEPGSNLSENPLEGYTGISGTTSEGEPGSNLSSTGIEPITPPLGTAGAGGLPESSTPMESQPASSSGFESNLTTSGLPGAGTESPISPVLPGENTTGSTGEAGSESTEIPGTAGLGSTEKPTTPNIIDRIEKLIKDIEKNKCTTDEQG